MSTTTTAAQPGTPDPPALDQTLGDYLRTVARGHLFETYVDDYRQHAAMTREARAVALGLNPHPYARPYPGSSNFHVQLPNGPQQPPGRNWLPIAAGAAAASGVLGPLAGLVFAWLSTLPATPPPPTSFAPSPQPPAIHAPADGADNDTRYNLNLRVE